MSDRYITLTLDNLDQEHICCAISDKKHQCGVEAKKQWLRQRLPEGHVFRKLDARGKVFIEYAPLETAWVPVEGENYCYIYCLWVSGSFQGKGHANALLRSCLEDARRQGKSGVCVLSSKKKKPYLSDRKFFEKYGFQAVDCAGEYELLALSFDGTAPRFGGGVKAGTAADGALTIYYGVQCPFIPNCVGQVEDFCRANGIAYRLIPVDSLQRAKELPGVFNNWAVFYRGRLETVNLLDEAGLKRLLSK